MHRISFFALVAALALSACATQDGQSAQNAADRDCFNAQSARSFDYIDDRHVAVTANGNRRYIFTTSWNARDLDWTTAIALRSPSGFICTGNGLGVDVIGGDPQRTYSVQLIERAPSDEPTGS